MVSFIALIAGIIFGFGIIGSGMVNPALVLAFLDVTGDWDATLLWVMGGAVTVGTIAFMLARKRERSYLGLPMQIPGMAKIDSRLLLGSLLFGIGWGIAGICPGPALVLAGTDNSDALVFLVAMLLGMGIYQIMQDRG
ncbi:MAG: YeeE/YedE family protein [Nitrosomonas oligotropha]|uniref:YeeE/YedE family protein n=1 Tax=Nitrosomonas oligotropha TaxID=42354 RepID=A0A5C7VV68_9PROT|nr:MAG: YeeE/YedE family protein [Nitrosomonas oligotropha]